MHGIIYSQEYILSKKTPEFKILIILCNNRELYFQPTQDCELVSRSKVITGSKIKSPKPFRKQKLLDLDYTSPTDS